MADGTIAVTDLKQWRYCQRVLYYRACLPQVRPVTRLMETGIDAHRDEAAREERRSLRHYGLATGERVADLALTDPALGLRGRLDLAIAVPDRTTPGATAVVVDYKFTEGAPGPHFRLQLAAYALLLEAAWGLPVPTGYLYSIPLRRADPVTITPALRREARAAVAAIRAMIAGEVMPAAPPSRAPCVTCEFRRFCNDVV